VNYLAVERNHSTAEYKLPPRLVLADDAVHIWYSWVDKCLTPSRSEFYRSLLNEDEQARLSRYAFEYLRREYLVTRALCRMTLSRYAEVHPRDWTFRANAYGRPEIEWPSSAVRLRFNLSNSGGLVACIVTTTADAGIDVEDVHRTSAAIDIAPRFFSPLEVSELHSLPSQAQLHRFCEIWTLKESYIKARGMGLSLPLDQFSLSIRDDGISIRFDSNLRDIPSAWQFAMRRIGTRHLLALAIRKEHSSRFEVAIEETTLEPSGGYA
jgi:4'-phosphopantetheinyl transferase